MIRIRQRTAIKPITKITKKLQKKKSPTFTPRLGELTVERDFLKKTPDS